MPSPLYYANAKPISLHLYSHEMPLQYAYGMPISLLTIQMKWQSFYDIQM